MVGEGSPGSDARESIGLRAAANAVFASPALVDLLIVLCREPERRFYVNELIRLTGLFPRSVQLALGKLEAAGLVRSERQANARFYRLAADHPFVPDLRGIVAKVFDDRAALGQALGAIAGVRVAFLRPTEAGAIDLDLVAIGDAPRGAIEDAVASAGRRLKREARVQVFTPVEWAREARRERSFVRWLLEEPREYVVGGEADLPPP
jgi:DNA-binding transcriptional ArsR family regulator